MSSSLKFTKNKPTSENNVLFLTIFVVTLIFSLTTHDPFNSPKQWILFCGAAWLFGHLIVKRKMVFWPQIKLVKAKILILLSGFLIPQFISALISEDLLMGMLGDVQRRNGVLTYLGLVIIFLYTVGFYKENNDKKLIYLVLLTSGILVIYGILQSIGKDPAKWNNPYNPVITTVGNPNFAAALYGILGSLLFALIFIKSLPIVSKVLSLVFFSASLYLIYSSESRQGLVILFFSTVIFLGILIYSNLNKVLGKFYFILIFALGALSLFGMLQKGPLVGILYKDSISVRGYYWRAALEMFFAKPMFGVGTDQYGSFFRFYKESGYVVRYGAEITSSNAHNLFLQLFATCGVITGTCYILITLGILNMALRKIIRDRTNQDILFLGLFVAWVSFQMQSFISIDNIALSIWGWVLGGLILNKSSNLLFQDFKSQKFTDKQIVVSAAVLLPVFIFCAFLYRSETAMLRQLQYANLQYSEQNKTLYIESARKVIDNQLSDANMKKLTAEKMFDIGFKIESLNTFDNLIRNYPSNAEYLMSRAIIRYEMGDVNGAMSDRIKLLKLDPWNISNMLKLGEIYKSLGKNEPMLKIRSRIESFASQTPEGTAARNNLVLP